jgi:hypothetical protein
MRAKEKLTQYRMKAAFLREDPCTSWWSAASIPLFTEHTCFQTSVLCSHNYWSGCNNISQVSPFYITFCGQAKCVLLARVCSLSFPVWNYQGHWYRPLLLRERLTAQWYHGFLETVVPELLQDVPVAMKQKVCFQHDGAPAHYGEDVQQWSSATYQGRWNGCHWMIA